jgi:hypothetical protein
LRLGSLKVDYRSMKYSAPKILILSLFFSFVTATLLAKNEGPLELSLPEGATITYQGSLGVSMYSIDSADIGHSMMITKIPSSPGLDRTSLLKIMSETFVQQMKAQEAIVGKLSPENPVPEDFKGEHFSGQVIRFTLNSEVLKKLDHTNFYLISDGTDTYNVHISGNADWVTACEKTLSTMKKK